MRVITGVAKGHKLKAPKGLKTRPTTDRIKETIFNIIQDIENDDYILDLFSGSGGVGIEFLSRGAKKCIFIDADLNSIRTIKDNLKNTKLTHKSEVYKNTYDKAIKILSKKDIKFDYIFIDPPYNKGLSVKAVSYVLEYGILKEDGTILVEHEKNMEFSNLKDSYKIETRNYGDTSISFLKQRR